MTPTEEIDLATYRRLTAAVPRKAKRPPRADIPRAAANERTGLTTMLQAGWSVQSPDSIRYRLYRIGRPDYDTGLCADEKTACDAAKRLEKGTAE